MKTEFMATPKGWQHLQYHEFSCLVEFGAGLDTEALERHIEVNGYDHSEPIVIYQDKILDGRHRHAACIKIGVTPSFARFVGKDPLQYVAKKIFRQHLDDSQRAMIGSKIATLCRTTLNGAASLLNFEGGAIAPISTKDAAKIMNVSEDSVKRAKVVTEQGSTKLQQEVMDGKKSLSAAAAEVKQKRNRKKKDKTPVVEREAGADEQEDPIKDEEGHAVPPSVRAVFNNLTKFKEIISACQKLQKDIDEIVRLPGGEQLGHFVKPHQSGDNTIQKSEHLENLKRDIKGSMPYSVCPWCNGKSPKNCVGCHGNGWVSQITWKNAEDSIKERLAC